MSTEPNERFRLAMRRRLQGLREEYRLPALSMRQTTALTTLLVNLRGDAPVDPDLRVLYRLTARGLLDTL